MNFKKFVVTHLISKLLQAIEYLQSETNRGYIFLLNNTDHPGRNAELSSFLNLTVLFRLLPNFLWEISHINMSNSLNFDPPLQVVFSALNVSSLIFFMLDSYFTRTYGILDELVQWVTLAPSLEPFSQQSWWIEGSLPWTTIWRDINATNTLD